MFAELKAHIKKAWPTFVDNPAQGFYAFLRKFVQVIGQKDESAEGHFRHTGIAVQRKDVC